MKRNVSLYIADTKVDLDDASLILFNYTKDDLTNPTVVKNSYSHSVKLKGTPTNNKLFGEIFRLDRQTLYSDRYNGAFFDPMRKTPFKIFDETSALLESGYVKLTGVSRNNNQIEYSVTLYGGIGSFFYSLSYTEEGNTRTLADMKFVHKDGAVKKLFDCKLTKDMLQHAWNTLKDPSTMPNGHCWDIINFAPCYNGLPSDFDANKALVSGYYYQFNLANQEDGITYTVKDGCTSRLVTMANKHTEWEVRNIRPYLQRPVVRIKAIFESIKEWAKESGYTFELDPDFFNANNPMYWDSWITLPIVKKDHRYSTKVLEQILKSSLSPLEYMVSYAKCYGLRFLYENNQIKLVAPKNFFQNEVVDIESRIDVSSIQINPITAENKWYLFGDNIVGEQAEKYKETYGVGCGSQKVNTGYEFNSEIKSLTKDIKFTDAIDVEERSFLYAGYFVPLGFGYLESFSIAIHEQVKIQGFEKGTENSKEFDVDQSYLRGQYLTDDPYVDWLPKVQLHAADNKALDGSGVLLIFNGMKAVPYMSGSARNWLYFLSDDHPDTDVLNEGTPCWNLDQNDSIGLTELPSFRRNKGDYSADWGIPQEYYTKDIPSTVKARYERYWKDYITDLYSADTSVLKCKVNLRGLQVGQDLLRKFYWYKGSIWVLNKIQNHSITTFDLAECEFVKVQDKENYINGQEL
jgi:hypothetical protein